MTLCIVNYNGEARLGRVLAAARGSAVPFGEILLVDDASRDASLDLIRREHPDVRVVARERNGGPAAARNDGFRAAAHDLVLFVDNDVALEPGCAGHLQATLESRADALVALPRVLYADRPGIIQYDGADCHFLGLMILRHHEAPAAAVSGEIAEVGSVVTCAFLVDRSRWDGGEPFDASFVFNLEDHDFGVRSRARGHTLLSVPAATCLHGEGTPGLSYRSGGTHSPTRVYCLIRNRWRIVLQTYALRTLLLLSPCLFLYELFQLAGVVRKGWLGSWLRAVGWMAANPGVVLRRRREVQRRRRTPDRQVLSGGPLPFTPELLPGKLERMARAWLDRIAVAYWRAIERYL